MIVSPLLLTALLRPASKKFIYVQLLMLCGVILFSCSQKQSWKFDSEDVKLTVEVVTDSIRVPFGMAFLPDGRLLVTDRPKGTLTIVDVETGDQTPVRGVPKVVTNGDGGIMDILPDPDFANNHQIFLTYSAKVENGETLVVDRIKLENDSLTEIKRIFAARPYLDKYVFFGNRIVLKDGYLYLTTGVSKTYQDSAQSVKNDQGKILRIRADGSIPEDNPYVNVKGAMPEIYAIGTRNAQGMTINPVTRDIWTHEHGPKGGDEINIVKPGVNYGWPVITFGTDYDNTPVGKGINHMAGMEQPLYYYKPSIAPSGMLFYTGDAFPMWKGNLFIGAMAGKHLNRTIIKNDSVKREERLFKDLGFRFRNVVQGPDGFIYVGVDGGKILRIRPQ